MSEIEKTPYSPHLASQTWRESQLPVTEQASRKRHYRQNYTIYVQQNN